MQSLKSCLSPLVMAAVLGLGFGFGVAQNAEAYVQTCQQICNTEYRECHGSHPADPYRCRRLLNACLNACD